MCLLGETETTSGEPSWGVSFDGLRRRCDTFTGSSFLRKQSVNLIVRKLACRSQVREPKTAFGASCLSDTRNGDSHAESLHSYHRCTRNWVCDSLISVTSRSLVVQGMGMRPARLGGFRCWGRCWRAVCASRCCRSSPLCGLWTARMVARLV